MSRLFDTTPIQDDAEYWDALAERVAANAAIESQGGGSGFDWLTQSSTSWIAASLLLAAAVAFMVAQTDNSSATSNAEWEQALAPADGVGTAIILRDAPPAIGALLLRVQGTR